MANVEVDILLVEDDLKDVTRLREVLLEPKEDLPDSALLKALLGQPGRPDSAATVEFHVRHQGKLASALQELTRHRPDMMLLDLGLPDSSGLATLEAVYSQVPELPIVVLTSSDDAELAITAMGNGAEDFLIKDQVDRATLVRSIRYAIQRHGLRRRMERERQRELASLARLTSADGSVITARYFGAVSLSDSAPSTFQELVSVYEDLLERTLESQTHETQVDLGPDIRQFARRLGFFKAGPRDAVLIHTTALKHKKAVSNVRKTHAYAQEGRYLLLELMGHLVSFYQKYAMGAVRPASPTRPGPHRPSNAQEWPE